MESHGEGRFVSKNSREKNKKRSWRPHRADAMNEYWFLFCRDAMPCRACKGIITDVNRLSAGRLPAYRFFSAEGAAAISST